MSLPVQCQVSGTWSVLFPSRKRSQNFDTQGWISARLFLLLLLTNPVISLSVSLHIWKRFSTFQINLKMGINLTLQSAF